MNSIFMNTGTPQLPKYKCHKEVWAIKIKDIFKESMPVFSGKTCRGSIQLGTACNHCEKCIWHQDNPGGLGATIMPEEKGFVPFTVSGEYMRKHDPQVGGYFVLYKDGYQSFSTSKAFEEGYTLVTEG